MKCYRDCFISHPISSNFSSFTQSRAALTQICLGTWTILHPADDASGLQGRWGIPTLRSSSDVDLSTRAVSILNNGEDDLGLTCATPELARGAKGLIRMEGNQTFLDPPEEASQQKSARATERKTMPFSFDKSYWSAGDRDDPKYCSQQTLFEDLGKELLDHAFNGFNACIMACQSPSSVQNIRRFVLTFALKMDKQV